MRKLNNPSEFPELSLMASFSGKTHEDAVGVASAWAKEVGATITHYFEQSPIGSKNSAILISYRKEINNEQ